MVEQPFETTQPEKKVLFESDDVDVGEVVIHVTEENLRQSMREAKDAEFKRQPSYNHLWKSWSTIAGGTIFMILVGSVYITGNITPYMASFYGVS